MVFVCASASNHSFLLKFCSYSMSGEKVCTRCLYVFSTNTPQHASSFVRVFVHSGCLSSIHSRERCNFLPSVNLCLSPYVVASSPRGCRPSLSARGNAVASNPSGGAPFDAHWQEPGSGCSACVVLSGEFPYARGPKQLRCAAAFGTHWPLFTSNTLPSCSLFELQCAKGNTMQKSFRTYTNGMLTTSLQIQNNGWLVTHVYYLRTYRFPHTGSKNPLWSPTSKDVRLLI